MKEFSDISQPDLLENEIANIPIFNMLEIILSKIILSQLEKYTSSSSILINKDK